MDALQNRGFLNLRRPMQDLEDGCSAQERYMKLQKSGDTVCYQGNSDEVGCYVAGHPLSKGSRYFEWSQELRGTIAVGLVPKFYQLDVLPGWLLLSVAYHADSGRLCNGSPVEQQFGPKCTCCDCIGCGILSEIFNVGPTKVFFTKNGKEVGSVEVPVLAEGLVPAVGMHSLGEEVKVDLQAEWLLEEGDSMMMVDGHEDDWGRLYNVRVSGVLLEYIGKGKDIMDVGLAQACQPLTTRCHYYEVEIVDAGEKCFIALGLARRDYPKNKHPGWSQGSIAYHADDGKIFQGRGVGDAFGPRCFKGDIMGCGIMFPRDYILEGEGDGDDCERQQTCSTLAAAQNAPYLNHEEDDEEDVDDQDSRKVMVFFTRNGKLIGRKEMAVPPGGLFPTVGMLSRGERVKVDLHPLSG